MSQLELYGTAICPFVQRVRLVLAEKNLSAAEIEVDPRAPPEGALSPSGKIPVLVHDGARLWASAVICEYLDEVFPAPALAPDTAHQRALMRIWIDFADKHIYEPTHRLLVTTDPAAQMEIAAQLAADVSFLESHALASGPYWMGDQATLADATYFPWFEQLPVLERLRGFRMQPGCVRLKDWFTTMQQRPSVQGVSKPAEFYLERYRKLAASLGMGAVA